MVKEPYVFTGFYDVVSQRTYFRALYLIFITQTHPSCRTDLTVPPAGPASLPQPIALYQSRSYPAITRNIHSHTNLIAIGRPASGALGHIRLNILSLPLPSSLPLLPLHNTFTQADEKHRPSPARFSNPDDNVFVDSFTHYVFIVSTGEPCAIPDRVFS